MAGATGPPPDGDPARTDPSRGPRNGPPAPAIPREQTIQAVQAAKRAGYDYLKVVFVMTPDGPELDTLKLIVEEGKKIGMPTIVHAVSVIDTLTAIEAHPDVLVHTPHIGRLDEDPYAIRKIVEAKIPMTSTLAVFGPHFAPDNTPLFRDAKPFPWHTLSSAGQGPVNARLLWNAGLVSYGYGTDTQWPPKETLLDELRALELVFSPTDIVKIITKNAANSTLHEAEIGTLEPGKFADIVIVDGDPLTDSRALLHVTTTIKGGEVVFGGEEIAGRSESDRDVRLRLTTRNRLGTSRSFPSLLLSRGGLPDAVRQVDARTVALRDAAAWTSLPVVNHFAPWRAEPTEIAGICDATLCGLEALSPRLARETCALRRRAALYRSLD